MTERESVQFEEVKGIRDAEEVYLPSRLEMTEEDISPGKKRTEIGVIPKEWEIQPLRYMIAELNAGVSVNSVNGGTKNSPYGPAILKTSSVDSGVFSPSEAKKIDRRDFKRARLNPKRDSIIISRMNTPELVGECGYVGEDYPDLYIPDRLWMAKPRLDVKFSVRWLNYVLSSSYYHYNAIY